jgi:hypothetical protein
VDEVCAGIKKLRNNKALGRSWLSADLMKQLTGQMAPILALILNEVRH